MNILKINDTSNKLYYVGGVVRDELLGIESLDVDITYVGNAIDFVKNNDFNDGQFEILQINEPFGTVKRSTLPPHVRKFMRKKGICRLSQKSDVH